jgi:hypothetical protein
MFWPAQTVRSGTIAPFGQRYRLFLTIAKSVSTSLTFWPTGDEVMEAPYTFQPGQEAVPLPQEQVPAVDAFVSQAFAYFVVQLDGQPTPTPNQVRIQSMLISTSMQCVLTYASLFIVLWFVCSTYPFIEQCLLLLAISKHIFFILSQVVFLATPVYIAKRVLFDCCC